MSAANPSQTDPCEHEAWTATGGANRCVDCGLLLTTPNPPTEPVVTQALKACPLCGDRDEFNPSVSTSHRYAEPGDTETGKVGNPAAGLIEAGRYVECDKCGCCGPDRPTEAEAIAAWNTRSNLLPATDAEGLVERDSLCRLIERYAPSRDDLTGLPIGNEVEALADHILAALSSGLVSSLRGDAHD